jgi:cellulose synthase/poly-beta-1,6-N-acetylglucosamine synthase-like glycosyltransferase
LLEIFFVASVFLIVHAYLGYPLTLWFLGLFRENIVNRGEYHPKVTLIITAYNEEKRIESKMENTLALVYPKERLQVLLASDGSTDRTNDIAAGYRQQGIELLAIPERKGKENAQKEAIKKATGDVLVFTDVATILEPSGIERIVSNFADASVGCVSSEDRLISEEGKPSGEGFYVRYEMWLRRLESSVNSVVGLSGSFFAARKEVCQGFTGDMQSDFRTLLSCVRMGLRGVSDPGALGFYRDISDKTREFDRKVRTVLRGLTVFFQHIEFLNVFRYGLFSYQYLCHKLLRWFVPVFLGIAFGANLLLATGSSVFFALFLVQCCFYGLGVWGWRSTGNESSLSLLRIPVYFMIVNASIVVAWWRYLRRQRIVMWTPSER